MAIFLWAAWDGIIAAHLLPGNMALSDDEFESVLQVARTVILRGLLAAETEPQGVHPTEPGATP
ncbi:MAG TPA: hypothetical protein VK790_10375 [Solirubrobacteraceae bacterium]|nr:hypothetical protein [Solirubrobacteraceae bacterium]